MKVAVCCIVKQENLYLRDWVEYYHKMGICNIILYDNNDIDGEYPQQVISDYIASGFVIYKDARGKYRFQIEAYTQCYNEYVNTYDWIAFFDIDEYWYLSPEYTFETFFNEFPNAYALFINWLCYGDNGLLHYDSRPVWERFKTPSFPLDGGHPVKYNSVKKCIVKCIPSARIDFIDSNGIQYMWCTKEDGQRLAYTSDGMKKKPEAKITFEKTHLKHYRTLTIEEFLYRRFGRRGYADLESPHTKDYILKMFWEQNEWTEEKQKIIDDFFSTFPFEEDSPEYSSYLEFI